MDFPFRNCIVSAENFSASRVRELLEWRHDMAYVLLDLEKLEEEAKRFSERKVAAYYLADREQEYLGRFTSGKRRREWLGGRLAAKYVAAGMLDQNENALPWRGLAVLADVNGRPFLATDKKGEAMPDISISHSGDLAAAIAVRNGFCGIDVQKVTGRVVKVRERFCTPNEEDIARTFFNVPREKKSTVLTKLWAAKEALRKVANRSSLPGFLELVLTEIKKGRAHKGSPSWKFIFMRQHVASNGRQGPVKCSVAVSHMADYALAVTTRNDTVVRVPVY
jgi:phosphopantetheinyl transferase (holo-ACP synthase)